MNDPTQLAEVSLQNNKAIPSDPWNRAYDYAVPGSHDAKRFDVSSGGPDEA